MAANWFLYLIRTRHDTLYAGITTDVAQRLVEHESGKQGAKYLRSKGPLEVVYAVELGSRSLASKAEYRIKRLTKTRKEKIVAEKMNRQALLKLLNILEASAHVETHPTLAGTPPERGFASGLEHNVVDLDVY